jgi:hypothetical protein
MLAHENNMNKARARSLALVTLMLGSIFVSMIPAVSASHVETYPAQRNPVAIASGDLDCDGDADIVSASEMGMLISVLYNEDGDFSDREDLWVSTNTSRRAHWFDMANANDVGIGDIDGDGANDLVFFRQNVWVASTATPPLGNMTVIWGDCNERVEDWTRSAPISVSPSLYGMEIVDINDDGKDDIVGLFLDESITNMEVMVMRGPNPTQQTSQSTTNIPLTHAFYYDMAIGNWGETVTGGGIPGGQGDCEDQDIWLMTAPPYNGPQTGFSAGNWDNVTVLEYNCVSNQYENPVTATSGTHKFALNENSDANGMDIADTDNDGIIDMVAIGQGWDQNVSYATRSSVGGTWSTNNLAGIGDYVASDVSIADINGDGNMDFLVPTMLTVSTVNSAGAGQQQQLTTDNLVDINTVNIILNDGSGNYLAPQTFDVGRRPTMVIADQFSGGSGSALDLAVGQRDYSFSYSNGAMWIDSKGWAGAQDTISIVELDSEDVGIGGVTVSPAAYDFEDQEMKIGAGTRDVNVTVRNTGLQSITGSVDVDVSVKEVVGGTDTVVYANDFDTAPTGSCSNCNMVGVSYSGEVAGSYWHVEDGSNNSGNGDEYEADTNPTDYMWAGALVANTSGDGDMETGYMSWWDEGLIIEDVDLTGADSASMDLDMMCMVQFSMIYYSSTGIANRIIYDDSCNIDVYSDSQGWSTVSYRGGYDYDRYVHLANGYYPEFTVSNSAYCCFVNPWDRYAGDSSVDLTQWAGEEVDIRFRFRSGHIGSVGNDNASYNTEWDGFAIDNITINKTVTQFGSNVQDVSQQLNLNGLAPGDEQVVTLQANFVNGTTYIIESDLSSTSGFTNGDDTNDNSRWKTTVKNLFDPSVQEITSFEKNALYASGNYPIDVLVKNVGNTIVDFDTVATIYSANPNDLLVEDFEGGASGYAFGDDGDSFGVVLDDTDPTINNAIVPGNRPVFGSSAYWFGHPDDGYGDDWDETMTLQTIDLRQNTADFVYLNFDYFAETDYLTDSEGDILAVQEYGILEVEWRKGGDVYNGTIIGNWNDYNENGVQYNETCEDIDEDGTYDETEYIGDLGWNVFFDSEGISKGVTLDLTHIFIRNTTSLDSRDWDYNCTDLSGTEVTVSYRFQSNGDGVNGNSGLAGFAIDNITVREYVFTYVTEYSTPVTGLDSQEDQEINIGNHDFSQGIYRIDAMTHYDNQTQGTAWYNHKEVNLANNVSRLIFEVASVDVQLLRPDVLDCVEDNTYGCVYPIDQVEDHAFSMDLVNGVLEGDYNIKLMVTDMTSGSVIFDEASAESPMTLIPHERSSASWAAVSPANGWTDGGNYNFSFYAELVDDGSISGNQWDFSISMAESIDVAILSNPTDQNRLSRVKADLDAMGMTYTQFYVEDWDRYITSTWMNHYNKILLPWQTTVNVEAGNYYTELNAEGGSDGLSPMAVIKNRMQAGATLEMHLGPYSNIFQDPLSNLPYNINVANRNVEGNFVSHSDTNVVDWHHPLLTDVNPVAFISFNGGHHVAESTLITTQTDTLNIPQVCGGPISAPIGTFHSIINDASDSTASLLATCTIGQGGMIVTTMDVENPSVSDEFGTTGKPLLSNLLAHQVTPYPLDFGPASDGFDLVINGEAMNWNSLQGRYDTLYMKSDADLEFSFTSDLSGLDADWELRPAEGTTATNWDGNPLQDGEMDHREEDTHTAQFCVLDAQSSTLCKQEAQWWVTLYLHDEDGHTRMANIMLETNDALADEFSPMPSFSIIDRLEYRGQIDAHGVKNSSDGSTWDINLIRLGPTGDLTVHFDASNSSDGDATDGTNGIKTYIWKIFLDNPWDQPGTAPQSGKTTEVSSMVSHSFTHRFQNITVDPNTGFEGSLIRVELTVIDQADKPSLQSDKYKMYFVVVGEGYGDDEPVVDFTSPAPASSQTEDTLYVNGSIVSGSENSDVMIEVALAEATLDLLPSQKFPLKTAGAYDSTVQLADGAAFSLALDIADLYDANGSTQTIWIKITEGDGSRWTIYKTIDVNLVPRESGSDGIDCDANPDAEGCDSSASGDDSKSTSSALLYGGVAALVLLLVIVVTLLLVRGRSGGETSGADAAGAFAGDVAEMDPVEAYVQQLVAQGYPEETARAYAQQYYAQAAQQQQ